MVQKPNFSKDCAKEFDKDGYSPLTLASKLGTAKILEVLIEGNADINQKDKSDRTALFIAALDNNARIAKVLCKFKEIDVDVKCQNDQTATDAARTAESEEVLKCIGNAIGQQLVEAGKAGNLDKVKELVKRPMINLEASDTTGWTALHFAMKSNFEEMVEVLAAAGADGNYKNMAGLSPIDIALKEGNKAILRLYEDTMKGVGRLEKQKREREKEPEKKVGVLKEEGTADAEFTHRKFTQDELMLKLKLAEQEEREEKKEEHKKDKKEKKEDKKKDKKTILSPRKHIPKMSSKLRVSPRGNEKKEDEEKPGSPPPQSPTSAEIEVKGGWTHKTKPT